MKCLRRMILVGMIAAALVTGLATEPVAADEGRTVALKATWFCGKSRNTRGAGGKLVSGESIALNSAQRKEWGLEYGDRVYVRAPKKYGIAGWKVVMDTGCRRGVLDAYYVDRSAVPKAFRRAGVVRIEMIVVKKKEKYDEDRV